MRLPVIKAATHVVLLHVAVSSVLLLAGSISNPFLSGMYICLPVLLLRVRHR